MLLLMQSTRVRNNPIWPFPMRPVFVEQDDDDVLLSAWLLWMSRYSERKDKDA